MASQFKAIILLLCLVIGIVLFGQYLDQAYGEPGDVGTYVEFSLDNAPEGNQTIMLQNWFKEMDNGTTSTHSIK